ncbi:hypothetical protein [Pontibacter russatus]|uniref:hypothetical protein n=1 Tax=Pontibacter russatus TaxID=2694929 RepID=UPI00137AA026|nr:hypothetical protein [Pontibacter russatus]
MGATIATESHTAADFQTDIDGCLSFTVENNGNRMLLLSFDKGGHWVPVKPDYGRDFEPGSGEVYEGVMYGKWGGFLLEEGEPEPAQAILDCLVLKNMWKCNK